LVRPAAVYLTTRGIGLGRLQRRLLAWFGVRGAGSVFYLAYAATHGLPASDIARLTSTVLPTIALSIILHGVSVTPLMNMYQRRMQRASAKRGGPPHGGTAAGAVSPA
jgi:NhaP-type Na+/H+ or K+/H+ antiporter